jgi:hypothetical protein
MQTYGTVDPQLFDRIVRQNAVAEPSAPPPKEH